MATAELTREQILAFQPGPELDVLVATRVMQWPLGSSAGYFGSTPCPFVALMPVYPFGNDGEPPSPEELMLFDRPGNSFWWRPSRDIAAAWRVVEKLRENPPSLDRDTGPWFQVQTPPSTLKRPDPHYAGWACGTFYEGEGFIPGLYASGETPALAICRAALLSVLQ